MVSVRGPLYFINILSINIFIVLTIDTSMTLQPSGRSKRGGGCTDDKGLNFNGHFLAEFI